MRWLIALLLFCLPLLGSARTVNDVQLPDALQAGENNLVLNGAGIRSKYFLDVYVAGLYLPTPSDDARQIINADTPQSIRLVITSSHITRTRLLDSIEEGVRKSAGKDFPRYQSRLQTLLEAMTPEVETGDQYDFTYLPGVGTQIRRNGEILTTLATLEFKQILFGIWLGQDPVQNSLKDELLGQA